jgi:carbon-monoxide dehydrogenase medium subunit
MIPGRFEYHAPTSLDAAISLLSLYKDDAKILSGGQSLIPLMKLRLAGPAHLIDINRIKGLDTLGEADGALRIGALVRESALEESALVRDRYPILADTARVIADPIVRNLATVCGNLAHGDPANDHPATMLALGAEIVARGPRGERRIPIAGFFEGTFTTALQPDEVLVEIRIPTPPPRSGGAYLKLERKVGDFATAGVAVQLTLGADGRCVRAGIGLTNVGPTPIAATKAAGFLEGKRVDASMVAKAGELAAEQSQPSADGRGSVEFKRDVVRVLAMRAVSRALDRAQQGS